VTIDYPLLRFSRGCNEWIQWWSRTSYEQRRGTLTKEKRWILGRRIARSFRCQVELMVSWGQLAAPHCVCLQHMHA
jgi:hypothetical protein